MSQAALRELIERAANDEEFVEYLRRDPVRAIMQLDVSSTELFTLTCADEDALRRLLGAQEDAMSVDFELFEAVAAPMFDEKVVAEIKAEAAAGGRTTSVTRAGVTRCCWG